MLSCKDLALSCAEGVLWNTWQLSSLLLFITFHLFPTPSFPRGGGSENHDAESFHFAVRLPLLAATQMMGFFFLFTLEVHKQISLFAKSPSTPRYPWQHTSLRKHLQTLQRSEIPSDDKELLHTMDVYRCHNHLKHFLFHPSAPWL